MEKKAQESFKEYTHKWRDLASQVYPLLTERETVKLFLDTLRDPYYDRLVGNALKNFSDMVLSGEMIDNAVKNGRMEGKEKKESTSRKKEGETQAVFSEHRPNQGYTPYPVYPQNPSYYPTINNVAPAPYIYPPPRPMAPLVRPYPTYASPLP